MEAAVLSKGDKTFWFGKYISTFRRDLPASSSWQHKHDTDDGDSIERKCRDPNRHEYRLGVVSMTGGIQVTYYVAFL